MANTFTFYAWNLSWYSGKVRPYLRYKGIPYTEVAPSLLTFYHTMPLRGGASGVPVVVTPEGEWINDSTVIIERMEARLPHSSVIPFTPRQRFFASLMEMWFDEFWHPTSIHTRWNFAENFPQWQREVGSGFLPWLPRWLQDRVAEIPRNFMLQVTKDVGATPAQTHLIDRWTDQHLAALDTHFAEFPFLLGARPSVADFALSGPIWGHFLYDQRSYRLLVEPHPHLHAWVRRLEQPMREGAAFLANDQVPDSLNLALRSVFDEMVPYLQGCLRDLQAFIASASTGERVPRFGQPVTHPFAGAEYTRLTLPYALWMAQRAFDTLQRMAPEEAAAVRDWVRSVGGEAFLQLEIPRLRRVGYQVALELPLQSQPKQEAF